MCAQRIRYLNLLLSYLIQPELVSLAFMSVVAEKIQVIVAVNVNQVGIVGAGLGENLFLPGSIVTLIQE
jgi:hypothetical protein